MKILVLNSGSSSIKYKLFNSDTQKLLYGGIIEEVKDFESAFDEIFESLLNSSSLKNIDEIEAFGHRVVHGGEKFKESVLINDEVIKQIENLIPLAPLHNPLNLLGIKTAMDKSPNVPQFAVFDTAFHQSMPNYAYMYAVPYELYERYGIRRYGFHGTSHHYVAKEAAKYLNKKLGDLNLISIHLGNGDSITAIKNGKSIDTSMGFSPLEGLMMGTRSGDLDPQVVLYLEKQANMSINEVDTVLNKCSGFKGICSSSDLRDVIAKAQAGDENSKLAINMFSYRVKKYIGAYKEVLQRVDAVIFTGGIGENSPLIREMICSEIDSVKNNNANSIFQIQNDKSPYKILVIPTDEEKEIARQVKMILLKSR